MMIEEILEAFQLFWQYPAITEKTFYEQNKGNFNYYGFPWATLIDKRINIQSILPSLHILVNPRQNYYTCCQHIHFRQLIPIFKILNINCVYTPHKIKGEDKINEVFILPCPLYAVNLEDPARNAELLNTDFMKRERSLLYSFHGAYNPKVYLSDVRDRLFNTEHPKDSSVKNIGGWFFESVVYSKKQNKNGDINKTEDTDKQTSEYNKLLLDSRYSLCPSGSGPNSIRFWESLGCGAIPVLLSDSLELPAHELWKDAVLRVQEKDLDKIPSLLGGITKEKETEMRENCLKLYQYYRRNFKNKKELNMVVFSNCHGEKYINIFKRDTNIEYVFNIDYIVSYQQLDNFNSYKQVFSNADILIINNIKKYEDYTIKNLKKLLKSSAQLIVIPFIRFEGYWTPEPYKKMEFIGENTVSYFPDIEKKDIENYITCGEDDSIITNHFEKSLEKLKQIENESDIKFFDFFVQNHAKIPFFRDNYHPTMNMLEYVAKEILTKIKSRFEEKINYTENNNKLDEEPREYGHYKPIKDYVAKILGLKFNLDKVFTCKRREYLETVIDIENSKTKIKDLDHMKELYFNN